MSRDEAAWSLRGDSAALPRELERVVYDCAIYEDGHRRPGEVPLEQAADASRSTSGFVWMGLQHPQAEDVVAVALQFGLGPMVVEDAVKTHQRPKLEVYGDVVFVVLKPVRYVEHDEVVEVTELAILLGPTFVLVTGEPNVLHRVREQLDKGDPKLLEHGTTGVLCRITDLVVDDYDSAIDSLSSDVDAMESQVFGSDPPGDHAQRTYELKREIAEFRRAVLPLATPLQRLAEGDVPRLDKAAAPYFRNVHDHVLRAADAIEGRDRLLSDILQADLARVTARHSEIAVRQNEDTRKISAWAAIALAPTAIAGIYGTNFDNMPELRWKYGYFIVLGVIVSACVLLHRLFRRNGWL